MIARWVEFKVEEMSPFKCRRASDLGPVLRVGKQRQRTAAAAIELSMRHPGTPPFETRMPGFRQRKLLGC